MRPRNSAFGLSEFSGGGSVISVFASSKTGLGSSDLGNSSAALAGTIVATGVGIWVDWVFGTATEGFDGALGLLDSSDDRSYAHPAKPSCELLGVDTHPQSAGSTIAAASAT